MIAGAEDRPLWAGMILIAAVWWATSLVYRPPEPAPAAAPPTQFSALRVKATLAQLLGDGRAHPLGSQRNAQVRARIVQALVQLGVTPQLQSGVLACSRYGTCAMPTNIVARLPGSDADSGDILLCAHYDSVPAGAGASDNLANVAAVLEIARILQRRARTRHPVVLLLDDGEEAGLLGAEAFVQHHPWARSIVAAVNLDARGTSGRSLMFETGSDNRWLMQLYAGAVAHPLSNSLLYQAYKRLPNDTDFSIFKSAGYQGFNLAFVGDVMRYHTPLDDWAHADPGSIQDQGQLALSTLWALANAPPWHAQPSEAVYFDLLGQTLVRVPQTATVPLAALTAVLSLLLLLRLRRRAQLPASAWAWGLGASLLATGAGVLLSALLLSVLTRISAIAPYGAYPFIAHPACLQWCFAALSVLLLTHCLGMVRLRTSALGVFGGWTVLNSLLSLIAAWALPAVSYLWSIPAVVACVGLLVWDRPVGRTCLMLIVLAVNCALWLPLTQLLYPALGTPALALLCELIIVSVLPASALVLSARTSTRRALMATTTAVAVIALIATLLQPPYTPESPQRVNVHYLLQADGQRGRWLVDVVSGPMPTAMSAVASFDPATRLRFPWGTGSVWSADAPWTPHSAPAVSIAALTCVAGHTHYRVHIAASHADTESLFFSPGITLTSVTYLNGDSQQRDLSVVARRISGQWSTLQFYTLPAQGIEMTLDSARDAAEFDIIDTDYGIAGDSPLQRARPPNAQPVQDGDVTSVWQVQRLPSCGAHL